MGVLVLVGTSIALVSWPAGGSGSGVRPALGQAPLRSVRANADQLSLILKDLAKINEELDTVISEVGSGDITGRALEVIVRQLVVKKLAVIDRFPILFGTTPVRAYYFLLEVIDKSMYEATVAAATGDHEAEVTWLRDAQKYVTSIIDQLDRDADPAAGNPPPASLKSGFEELHSDLTSLIEIAQTKGLSNKALENRIERLRSRLNMIISRFPSIFGVKFTTIYSGFSGMDQQLSFIESRIYGYDPKQLNTKLPDVDKNYVENGLKAVKKFKDALEAQLKAAFKAQTGKEFKLGEVGFLTPDLGLFGIADVAGSLLGTGVGKGVVVEVDPTGDFYRLQQTTRAPRVREFPLPAANSQPRGITAGPDGAAWFTEFTASKIGRITTSGQISESPLAALASPWGITTGPDKALWFTELGANRIGRITTSGQVSEFPLPVAGSQPQGITSGADGALWFTESIGNKIGRITTSGQVSEFPLQTARSLPAGIAAGKDGALWFTEFAGNKIGRVTTAGRISEFPVGGANPGPDGITAGPGGNIWFTNFNTNTIGEITPAGKVTLFRIPTTNSQPSAITADATRVYFTEFAGNKIGSLRPGTATPGGGKPVTLKLQVSHTYPQGNPGYLYLCGNILGPAGTSGTITISGPNNYKTRGPFTVRPTGRVGFIVKITAHGPYLVKATAGRNSATKKYTVPPPPKQGPLKCAAG